MPKVIFSVNSTAGRNAEGFLITLKVRSYKKTLNVTLFNRLLYYILYSFYYRNKKSLSLL